MKNGFTIIELIVSIFILSIGVLGVFSAFSMITILTSSTADRLTATYLAQEGMEIVRNIRDTNWLNMDGATGDFPSCASGNDPTSNCPFSWVDGIDNCESFGCQADYTTGTSVSSIMNSWSGDGDYLFLNTDGFYSYDTNGTQTKFKRKITIAPVTDVDTLDDHIIKVKVEVSWNQKATILKSGFLAGDCTTTDNCITTEETLYDWYNYAHH